MNRRNVLKQFLAGGASLLVLNESLTSRLTGMERPAATLTLDLNDARFAPIRTVDGYMAITDALAPGIQAGLQGGFPLALVRNSQSEISAMERFCIHQGCDVGDYDGVNKRFQCSCHGSRYDSRGNVTRGPAPTGGTLKKYPVAIAASIVTISNLPGNSNWNLTSADSPSTPSAIELRQNYPNPFNPTTRITYVVGSRMHINLTVHDAAGREVAVLVDAVQETGMHVIDFDASRLAGGSYFYTLRAGGFTESKQMMLLK